MVCLLPEIGWWAVIIVSANRVLIVVCGLGRRVEVEHTGAHCA
jgi:hypothetical protein